MGTGSRIAKARLVWESGRPCRPLFHASVAGVDPDRKGSYQEMTETKRSAAALLLSMTMLEAQAMEILDTIATERAQLREIFPDLPEDGHQDGGGAA